MHVLRERHEFAENPGTGKTQVRKKARPRRRTRLTRAMPRARVAWAHSRVSDPTLAAVFQRSAASVGAELRLANGVLLLAKFDGEFASHSSTYAGTVR
jgi:hypothetical protein